MSSSGVAKTCGGDKRRQSSQPRPRPRQEYPPPPELVVFNPLWICCLCCPSDLTTNISSCMSKAFDTAFDGAAECVGQIIGFIFGPLMIFLGPVMVLISLGIIALLSYTFFIIVLPMLAPQGIISGDGILHISIVLGILMNVLYNYYMCYMVKNVDVGPKYDAVVKDLALATGFAYPETDTDVEQFRLDYARTMKERARKKREDENAARKDRCEVNEWPDVDHKSATTVLRRRPSGNTNNDASGMSSINAKTTPAPRPSRIPPWMLLEPQEWGYCTKSNKPKPPRSHYDAVTKCLILNMDHYCPWTFNAVGYFNYRYFVTFILHVFLGMIYALCIGYAPFSNRSGPLYDKQIQLSRDAGHATTQHMIPFVPTPEERLTLIVTYVLVILTFLGVGFLFWFHLHLVLSAQTTIEERGNKERRRHAERDGKEWDNPYSVGWKQNWKLVFGSRHPLLAIWPSSREPEFLPLPINGKLVRRGRHTFASNMGGKAQCSVV